MQRSAGPVRVCVRPGLTGGSFIWRGASDDALDRRERITEHVLGDALDTIIGGAGIDLEDVALVWADVEGSEAEVIESGADLWKLGVPLWAEINPEAQTWQGSLQEFIDLAINHFDRFITSSDLVRLSARAVPAPARNLPSFIRTLAPDTHTDVLFLPARFSSPST